MPDGAGGVGAWWGRSVVVGRLAQQATCWCGSALVWQPVGAAGQRNRDGQTGKPTSPPTLPLFLAPASAF
eukprot:365305-Chlamydomonas_euryale.AAC.7